ncbi:MAG: methionine--tRNA ligase [Candidatus Paceibacterota bacterium]
MKCQRYITTTLPYVNADPHLGFALEIVQADALARFWRILGHEVFFNTGTDEYGQKIEGRSREEGRDIQEYVEAHARAFKALKEKLNLSYDNFLRTTLPEHAKAAQEMWRRCNEKGDIYKKKYKGKYCVGDEMFVRESDLIEGKCPNHPNMELQEIEEENYFFKFSNYREALLEYLTRDGVIIPEWRRKEAVAFVEDGLENFSISRERERMSWGISVPDDETQVMYVWFDALTNYISTLGWPDDKNGNFKKFWEEGYIVQTAGKDQVRFQSLMWQAMLFSAGVKNTDMVFYHGFITSKGQKMSKSLGNVISPDELVARYGTDATRYLLLRHVHPFEDTDITHERLDEWYTANLVNGLGNVVARIMKMSQEHLNQYSGVNSREEIHMLDEFNFQKAMDSLWSRIQALDEKITATEPFKLIKDEPEKAKELIRELGTELLFIGRALEPFMPETAKKIHDAVVANKKPENLFPRLN